MGVRGRDEGLAVSFVCHLDKGLLEAPGAGYTFCMTRAASVFIALVALAANLFAPQSVAAHLPCCEPSAEPACQSCVHSKPTTNTALSTDKPCCKPITHETKTERAIVLPVFASHNLTDFTAVVPAKMLCASTDDSCRFEIFRSTNPQQHHDLLSFHSRLNI